MAFDNLYLTGGDMFTRHGDSMTGIDNFPSTDFTAINSSPAMHNSATVSPQELLNSFSTPESGYLESPALASSVYNTTPLEDGGFLDDTLDYSSMDMPLFPQDSTDQFTDVPMQRTHSQTYSQSSSASPMVRQRSGPSPGSRPGTAHSRKPSLVAGVAKTSTKSRKPLPDIVINEDDAKEIAKRKKNTAAARKSRANRASQMEFLEAEVARLRGICQNMGVDPDEGLEL
jgi:hypothetical protein